MTAAAAMRRRGGVDGVDGSAIGQVSSGSYKSRSECDHALGPFFFLGN